MAIADQFLTHAVENQVPALSPYDAWATDLPLREALEREGGGWAAAAIAPSGPRVGGELWAAGFLANEHRPRLRTYDPRGHRIDDVEFHPAYHRLLGAAIEAGCTGFAWRNAERTGAHVARAALYYLHGQPEQGVGCPTTMTYAAVPALRHEARLAGWADRAIAPIYDARSVPAAAKGGNTIGMGMTEKQGGSDVRSNTTRAHAVSARGGGEPYELVGHKWFFSAPMCDAHLVLAQAESGLSCFLMPRLHPDGRRNAVRIQRLKDKLGNWSNASCEIELQGALAWLVGEEGRGVATILEMVALTRLDCVIGSAAIMRQALVQAVHHARHRKAFGRRLAEQPLMQAVLADLALESEAALALMMRVARAVDGAARDPKEAALARIATAVAKYWVCKRCPPFVNEAQECLGGAGYVEESILPRLYREAPLNSIWEGSGNVQCLDVLRAITREPETRAAFLDELATVRGADARLDAEAAALDGMLADRATLEARSRFVVERMALALQAAVLLRAAPALGAAFCALRLEGAAGRCYGAVAGGLPVDLLLERALPG